MRRLTLNSHFHKTQAEALIKEANSERAKWLSSYTKDKIDILLDLAQVHATLATVPDSKGEYGDLGPA